jgi:hypothetical protein
MKKMSEKKSKSDWDEVVAEAKEAPEAPAPAFRPDPKDPTYSVADGRWEQLVNGEWKSGRV